MKNCKCCGGEIEQGRVDLDLPHCLACAKRINVQRVKGRMVYEHKTGGYIETMSPESYATNRKFFTRSGNRSVLKQV
jgi:reverse gyrase